MCISILEAKFVRKKCTLYTGKYGILFCFVSSIRGVDLYTSFQKYRCFWLEKQGSTYTRINLYTRKYGNIQSSNTYREHNFSHANYKIHCMCNDAVRTHCTNLIYSLLSSKRVPVHTFTGNSSNKIKQNTSLKIHVQ